MKEKTIAFVGAGNMGRCLIGGLIRDGFPADRIRASDPSPEQRDLLQSQYRIACFSANPDAMQGADVVVLAVKPQLMRAVVTESAAAIQRENPLVISVAAGIRTSALAAWLGDRVPLVRAMPNTPAMVSSGATALFAGPAVTHEQRELAEAILRSVGLAVWLDDEALMDTITALSGSGPAYFFLFMELLQQAAVSLGLPAETARIMTLQTAFGAAKMALESEVDPAGLRAQVTSPGGTTEQAIKIFQDNKLGDIIAKAVRAAQIRSDELAQSFGGP